MQRAGLGSDAGGDELPVFVQQHDEKKPIEPGDVVGEEQHGPRSFERFDAEGFVAKQDFY